METISTYPPEKIFAMIIGVGQRTDDDPAMAVTASDAEKIAYELKNRCGLPEKNIQLLLDKGATKAGILSGLDQLISKTKGHPAEMVWVYFSGHGAELAAEKEKKYFLIAHDTVKENIAETAVSGNGFVEKLQAIQTERMLVLLDCCHAGGIGKDDFLSVPIPFNTDALFKYKNRVLITASHASQKSFLSRPISIFSFAFAEGLAGKYLQGNEKTVTVFDLAMYIRERVYPLSNKKQQPQLNVLKDSLSGNFALTTYPENYLYASKDVFDTAFELIDSEGKNMDTEMAVEKDAEYRQQFNWLIQNTVTIDGDDNIVTTINGQYVTIHNHASDKELLEIMKQQQLQINDFIKLLKNQESLKSQQTAERIIELQQKNPEPINIRDSPVDKFVLNWTDGGDTKMTKAIQDAVDFAKLNQLDDLETVLKVIQTDFNQFKMDKLSGVLDTTEKSRIASQISVRFINTLTILRNESMKKDK